MLAPTNLSRRQLVKSAAAALAACSLDLPRPRRSVAAEIRRAAGQLRVERIDRTTVKVPYREIPARNMARELPHWRYSEIFQVRLKSGYTGLGETLLFYTWGATSDEDVQRAAGKNAAEIMWDDSLGAGLQMALMDGVARTLGVPVHALLGQQVHQRTPLSWWNIDTSPEDMAAECQEADRQGYQSYKTKGRPWFDVWKQVELSAKVVPDSFKIDMDFNNTLLDATRGIPILKDLEKYPQVDIYESPIPQGDVAGNQAICAATRVAIAMHYGTPDPLVALREDVCDGFVVSGGASELIKTGAVCAMADKPFWLQLVGTGITAAYCLHFAAVLSHARWPAVNCHQLYTHDMLRQPIAVQDGMADVPTTAGLGYELDEDAVQRFRADKPPRRPEPPRLIETIWPSGRKMYLGNTGQVNFVLNTAQPGGEMPYFERGVTTRLVPNDDSQRWREIYEKARRRPVFADA